MSDTDTDTGTGTGDGDAELGQVLGGLQEHREEREAELLETSERAKSVLDALTSETVHHRLGGKRLKFRVLDGATEDWIDDVMGTIDDDIENNTEAFEEYREGRERITRILADHAVDDDFDYAFWKQVPQQKRYEALAAVRQGGEEADAAGNGR